MIHRRRYRFKKKWKRIAMAIFDGIGTVFFSILPRVRAPLPLRPERILVVRIDSLGDGVLTLPALEAVKKRFPEAQIDFLVSPAVRELYACFFPLATFHLFENNWFETMKKLWSLQYDLGIDFRGDLRVILLMTFARIPHRWGRGGTGGGFLLTHQMSHPYEKHELLEHLELVQGNGLSLQVEFPKSPFPFKGIKTPEGKKIVIHVGAGCPSKRWATVNFIQMAKRIQEKKLGVPIFIGTEEEKSLLRPFREDLGAEFLDLTGKTTLAELLGVLEQADLFVGNDSGPAHLAALLDRKILLVFSGTNDYRKWAPWSSRIRVVNHPVPCSPCEEKTCPLERHFCMEEIPMDQVFQAVEEMLRDGH